MVKIYKIEIARFCLQKTGQGGFSKQDTDLQVGEQFLI
jgi:hypothetical protein